MSHAWPAGSGGQNTNYVDNTRVNYPSYITSFFFANNLRVASDPAPTVTSCSASVATDKHTVTVNGAATDNGSVASYRVVLTGTTAVNEVAGAGQSFTKQYTTLADGNYTGTVSATDNLGQVSATCNPAGFQVRSAPAVRTDTTSTVMAAR